MREKRWRSPNRPQNTRTGKYFMLSDFLYSETAAQRGIANCPALDGKEVAAMRGLCEHILDPLVERFGPVSITFGYVSRELAIAIWPGQEWKSGLHSCYLPKQNGATLGIAADVLVHSMEGKPKEVLLWVKENCVYDRLIAFPGSNIVCVAWTDKPRYHCKEWVFASSGKPTYQNAFPKREQTRQLGLFDSLGQ